MRQEIISSISVVWRLNYSHTEKKSATTSQAIWANLDISVGPSFRLGLWIPGNALQNASLFGQQLLPHSQGLIQTQGAAFCGFIFRSGSRKQLTRACFVTKTGVRRITTFRSTTDRLYDGGPITLQHHCVTSAYSTKYSNMLYRFVA